MSRCILSARHTAVQFAIAAVNGMAVTERAAVMVVMIRVAVMPVPVMCPAAVNIPPARVIAPIPRTLPCVPVRTPEPVVDNRPVHIYRFDDVVDAVHVLIAYHLYRHIVRFVFLHIDGSNVLINILCEDSLQYDEPLVALARFHYAQVVHLTVTVEVEVTERAVWVVQHRLELFQVLSLCKQLSYNLQIESFRDVRTVGRYRDRFVCP